MATVLVVTPNPLVDHVFPQRLVPGTVHRVPAFQPVVGGKGMNVGRVLARHGHRVWAAGFAGGPTGHLLRELVAADGMEPLLIETAAPSRVGFVAVDPAGGGATMVLGDGFAVEEAERDALLDLVRQRAPDAELVIVSGSVPDQRCVDMLKQLLASCAALGVACWVDSYGPAMDAALASPHPPSLGKPNRDELRAGSGFGRCGELHISDGPNPIEVRTPRGRFRVTPPPVHELNPIGSGDSYLAGLAHGRLAGWPLERQLRYAAAAGAANAAQIQVAQLGPAQIEPLVASVRVERVDDNPGPAGDD